MFSARGYDGTSIRDIAKVAEVHEPLVYRHFPNKAALFEQAVIEPLRQAVDEFTVRWSKQDLSALAPEVVLRRFIGRLYDLCSANRGLLIAVLAASVLTDSGLAAITDGPNPFDELFDKIEGLSPSEAPAGYEGDPRLFVRLTIGLVLSAVLADRANFPPGRGRPSRKRIVDELLLFLPGAS